jgi:SAM-dependent methyltransferase
MSADSRLNRTEWAEADTPMTSFSERYTGGAYLEHAPDWHTGDAEWKAGKVLEMIERHGLRPGTVCDVGCGAGEVLARLRSRMSPATQFTGFDISPHAIELARPREAANLRFFQRDFSSAANEVFDLVLLLDVFEHVADYLTFLSQLRARGRHFIFHIPLDLHAQSVLRQSRYMLAMRRDFGHLHYFTLETALATLTDSGYAVIDHFYTWDHETIPLSSRELRARPWRWGIQALDRALFHWAPALGARLRPHFNSLVLARPGGHS